MKNRFPFFGEQKIAENQLKYLSEPKILQLFQAANLTPCEVVWFYDTSIVIFFVVIPASLLKKNVFKQQNDPQQIFFSATRLFW